MRTKKPILIIMDGWGWREDAHCNAVRMAKTPNVDRLWDEYPHTLINASGPHVGLPDGQMGNSEVGHLNLGAGRVVFQDLVRINRAIDDGSFFTNDVLVDAFARKDNAVHLLGLLSDGGVHSHERHLFALLELARKQKHPRVFVHVITDGRDTTPNGGVTFVERLLAEMKRLDTGRIASVVGRYYAMDRDRRWERTGEAYRLFRSGARERFSDAVAGVKASYTAGVTDEFIRPISVPGAGGAPITIQDDDTVVFFNFRADRARQITRAFTAPALDELDRGDAPRVRWICMTRYDASFDLPVAFTPQSRRNILAETAAAAGKRSLRIAETEKYAHVTYFFNGGEEKKWPGEERVLVPSPKVATYDQQPAMSADEICDRLIEEIREDTHDYIICNFANPDMVGHTGVLEAAITACETVDGCIGRIIDAADLDRYVIIVTADHGNADQMWDYATNGPHTAHTTNPVPCILVDPEYTGSLIQDGALRDIAPTLLSYMGVEVPGEMTGRDLRLSGR